MSPIQIILGIFLVGLIGYIIYRVFRPKPTNTDALPKLTQLKTKTDIVTADVVQSTLLGKNGSTVMGFFKIMNGDRTSTYNPVTDTVSNTTYNNTFIPLLYVANNWYIEVSPTAVELEKGKDAIFARLRVQVNNTGAFTYEYIDLPSIPKQKWVFIVLLREGRRFDVLYDNKLVASHRLEHYPVIISSPLSIGNKGLDGSAIHIITTNKRLTPMEVERERLVFVDTNNTVLEDNTIDMSFPVLKLFASCPSGLPCDPITKPPSSNLLSWKSDYA